MARSERSLLGMNSTSSVDALLLAPSVLAKSGMAETSVSPFFKHHTFCPESQSKKPCGGRTWRRMRLRSFLWHATVHVFGGRVGPKRRGLAAACVTVHTLCHATWQGKTRARRSTRLPRVLGQPVTFAPCTTRLTAW